MSVDYTRETPIGLLGNLIAYTIIIAMSSAIGVGLWFGIVWIGETNAARTRAIYASCVARGGLITEGGISGRLCVGVSKPD